MKIGRHGQAAVEFLLTYGWAFLIIIAIIAGIIALDPLSAASTGQVQRCDTGSATLTCDAQRSSARNTGTVQATIQNTGVDAVTIANTRVENGSDALRCGTEAVLRPGESVTLTCPSQLVQGQSSTAEIVYDVYKTKEGPRYRSKGQVRVTATPGGESKGFGEAGRFFAESGEWVNISFAQTYIEPIVIGAVQEPSVPGVIFQAENVSNESALMRLCAPSGDFSSCRSTAQNLAGYIVVEGSDLPEDIRGGRLVTSGTEQLLWSGLTSPRFFADVQSIGSPVVAEVETSRVRNGDAEIFVCAGTGNCGSRSDVEVGWVAFSDNVEFNKGRIGRFPRQNHPSDADIDVISAPTQTGSKPVVVAATQGSQGTQKTLIDQVMYVNSERFGTAFCELDSGGGGYTCDGHSPNPMVYFVHEPGIIEIRG